MTRNFDPYTFTYPPEAEPEPYYYVDDDLLQEPNLWVPGKKPVGKLKVDFSNPLSKGCIRYDIMNNATVPEQLIHYGTTRSDLEGGSTTDYEFAPRWGNGMAFRRTAELDIAVNCGETPPSQEANWAFIWQYNTENGFDTDTTTKALISIASARYSSAPMFFCRINQAASKIQFWVDHGYRSQLLSSELSGNTTYTCGWSYNSTNTEHKMWINGRQEGTTFTGDIGSDPTGYVWWSGYGNDAIMSMYSSALFFGEAKSDADMRSLTLDPYQFLIPA